MIDGVDLQNANGESCGGSFAESFAESCNSVFAPLGVKLGAQRARGRRGALRLQRDARVAGAAMSTLPPAAAIDSPLAVGSTAIGQGKVLATPLEMAVVADTIASGGVRHKPTLARARAAQPGVRVTTRRVARDVEKLMIGGRALRDRHGGVAGAARRGRQDGDRRAAVDGRAAAGRGGAPPPEIDTDAWFAAYAPTSRPKLAVGVLFVKAGAGGRRRRRRRGSSWPA